MIFRRILNIMCIESEEQDVQEERAVPLLLPVEGRFSAFGKLSGCATPQ